MIEAARRQSTATKPETGFVRIEKVGFAMDSPLEGDGFEPSVPRQRVNGCRHRYDNVRLAAPAGLWQPEQSRGTGQVDASSLRIIVIIFGLDVKREPKQTCNERDTILLSRASKILTVKIIFGLYSTALVPNAG